MNKHEEDMLDTFELDARKARRGAAISNEGKTRITIYLDNDVIKHFRKVATAKGRGYQTEINNCLRQVIEQKTRKSTPTAKKLHWHGVKLHSNHVLHRYSDDVFEGSGASRRHASEARRTMFVGCIHAADSYVVRDQLRIIDHTSGGAVETGIGVRSMKPLDLVSIHLLARQA